MPKYTEFQDDGRYTWLKAPRFQGEPMQVGPLAQVMVGYAQGHEMTKKYVDDACPGFPPSPGSRSDRRPCIRPSAGTAPGSSAAR